MRRFLTAVLVAATVSLAACATDREVIDTCREHGGVQNTDGPRTRLRVACVDGHYRTVR